MAAYTASLGLGSNYPATILAETSLLHYWRLNEASGTVAADSVSAGALNGTYQSAPTLGVAGGPVGSTGVQTASAAQKVTFSTGPTLTPPYAVECWMMLSSFPNWSAAEADYAITSSGSVLSFGVGRTGPVVGLGSWIGSPVIHANASLNEVYAPGVLASGVKLGEWMHIVATCDAAGNLILYVNGQQVNTHSGTAPGTATITALAVGASGVVSYSDIALYNAVLTPAQIAAHWNAGGNRVGGTDIASRIAVIPRPLGDAGNGQNGWVNTVLNPECTAGGAADISPWLGGFDTGSVGTMGFADGPNASLQTCYRLTGTMTQVFSVIVSPTFGDNGSGIKPVGTMRAGGWVPVNGGQVVTAGYWVKFVTNVPASGVFSAVFYWRDARGLWITSTASVTAIAPSTANGTWVWVTAQGTAPANAAWGTFYAGLGGNLAASAFEFRMTGFVLAQGARTLTDFFDGTYSPRGQWLGTAHNSASLLPTTTRASTAQRAIADSAQAVETIARQTTPSRAVADTALAAETVVRAVALGRALGNGANGQDGLVNYIRNPIPGALGGWSSNTATTSVQADATSPTGQALVVANGTGADVYTWDFINSINTLQLANLAVAPGDQVTLAAYVKYDANALAAALASSGGTTGQNFGLTLWWRVGTTYTFARTSFAAWQAVGAGNWFRASVTATIPEGANAIFYRLYNASAVGAWEMRWAGITLTKTASDPGWFDPTQGLNNWLGSANNSSSLLPKFVRQTAAKRIAAEANTATDQPVTNLWPNPNFEHDAVGAAPAALTLLANGPGTIVAQAVSANWSAPGGTRSLRLAKQVSGLASDNIGVIVDIPVVAGNTYYWSVVANVASFVQTVFASVTAQVQWRDSGGATISTAQPSRGVSTPGPLAYLSAPMVAPVGAVTAHVIVYTQVGGPSYPQGAGLLDVYFDHLYFGTQPFVGAANGDLPGASWSGTPGASASTSGPTVARALTSVRSLAEAAVALDSFTRVGGLGRNYNEALALLEALSRATGLARTLVDTALANSTVQRTVGDARSVNEIAQAFDALNRMTTISRADLEAVGGTDVMTVLMKIRRALLGIAADERVINRIVSDSEFVSRETNEDHYIDGIAKVVG